MKTKLEKLLILVFTCFIILVSAQKQLIIGTVLDDSQPLPGATIKIKGLSKISLRTLTVNLPSTTFKKVNTYYISVI